MICILGSLGCALCIALLVLLVGVIIDFPTYSFAILSFLLMLLINPFYLFCWVSLWRSSDKSTSFLANRVVKALVFVHIAFFACHLTLLPGIISRVF